MDEMPFSAKISRQWLKFFFWLFAGLFATLLLFEIPFALLSVFRVLAMIGLASDGGEVGILPVLGLVYLFLLFVYPVVYFVSLRKGWRQLQCGSATAVILMCVPGINLVLIFVLNWIFR